LYYSLNPSVAGMNYDENIYAAPVYSTLEGVRLFLFYFFLTTL